MRNALLSIAAALALAGCSALPSPVHPLTPQQAAGLGAFTPVPLLSAAFTTSALVQVEGGGPSKNDVSRHAGATSAGYAGVSKFDPMSPPGVPATSGEPAGNTRFDFKKAGDSAQGWATMSDAGMPFLSLTAFGLGKASGTASWRARVNTAPGADNVYVQFHLPVATVTGFTEQNGPSRWQSRVRADLFVGGHPFWSTEASRQAELVDDPGGDSCANGVEKQQYLTAYGSPIGFKADKPGQSSTAQTVTLWLGAFPVGQTVDLSFVVRADAQTFKPCCNKQLDADNKELFCTRATATLDWDAGTQPVKLWVGPALQ